MTRHSGLVPTAGYEALVEQSTVGVCEVTDDEFSYVNPRFAEVFGYSQSELRGTSPFAVIAERDHQSLDEDMETLASGETESITAEYTGVREDGDEVVVRVHWATATRTAGGSAPVYLGFVEDVTERTQREQRLEAVFDNTFQFTGILDPDGTVLEANETALHFGGVDRDEVVGTPVWETYWFQSSEEARETARAAVAQAREGDLFRDEVRVQGAEEELVVDFSVRPVTDETGTVSQLVAEGRDITERKERERERQTVIDRVTDAVVEVDEDWQFTLVDDRAEEIYGRSEAQLVGENFWDVFSGTRGTRFESVYREVMDTREPATLEAYNSDLGGWFHVEVYPRADGGLAFYFQDVTERKRREERTAGLNEVLSACLEATSKQQVCEILTENADGRLHLPVVVVGLFDEKDGLRPVAQSPLARAELDEAELFDQDSGVAWRVFTTGEPERIDSPAPDSGDPGDVEELFVHPLGRHGVLVTGAPSPDAEFDRCVAEEVRLVFDRIDREKRLQSRDELLEDRNNSLDRLNRINTVIRSIDQELVRASTRAEIERAVCERLTDGEAYTFAWVGEYDPATGQIDPKDWAGHHQGYLDAVSFSADTDGSSAEPTGAAVRTREAAVRNELLDDPPHEPWQEAALKRGYRSVVAVPLLYQDSLYGTLTAYSDRADRVDDMERQVLTELGETVAHAINAVESKRALVSDTVVELELAVSAADHPLVEFVERDPDRTFEFESVVPSDDGMYRVFYFVHGTPPETYLEFADRSVAVRDTRLIAEHDEKSLFESTLTEESLLFWLIDRGAVPRSFDITPEDSRLRVDLAGDIAIREFVELLKAEYPDTELIASRKRERKGRTCQEFESRVEEHLTARQQEVLQTAYFSGYFDTPRTRTGEELAESLGVSSPTVSDHIRAGLRNLFELLYEEED